MATKPRYWLHLKNARPPKNETESDALNKRLSKAMGSVVAPTFGEEMLDVMPITRDEQTPSDINEVRRWLSADSGVPPPLLGSPDSQTFANLGSLLEAFWEVTVLPEAGRIAAAVRQQGVLPNLEITYDASPAMMPQKLRQAELRQKQAAAFGNLMRSGLTPEASLILSGLREAWDLEGGSVELIAPEKPEPEQFTGGNSPPPPRMLHSGVDKRLRM